MIVMQFSVTLQSDEQILESCRRGHGGGGGASGVTGAGSLGQAATAGSPLGSTVTSYSRHEEFCLSTMQTHISISIPLSATPTFTTELRMLIYARLW